MNSFPLKPSATMAMNTKINELLAAGHTIYHLGFGEARFPVHPKILAALRQHAAERSYLPVAGLPALRAAVAAYYQRKFQIRAEPNRVLIGPGSKSLLFAAMHSLPGDLLLPAPSWVSYDVHAVLTGKAVHWIPTHLAENHCLTPEGLQQGLAAARGAGQTPGILVLNNPTNPTGVVYPPELLAGLAEVARAEGLVILSDEIYAETTYGEVPHTSLAGFYPEGTVVTGGLSKHLSLGGWRLGVAVLPTGELGQRLQRDMVAVAGNIWTTAAAPVQYAAVVAYGDAADIEAYVQTCTTIHGYVTGYLHDIVQGLGMPCPRPTGGFYLYPSFAPWRAALAERHNVHTSAELAHFLLDEEHIATLPGSDFGAEPGDLTLRLATSYLYALTETDGEAMLATFGRGLPADQFLREACPRVIEVGEKFRALVRALGGPG